MSEEEFRERLKAVSELCAGMDSAQLYIVMEEVNDLRDAAIDNPER